MTRHEQPRQSLPKKKDVPYRTARCVSILRTRSSNPGCRSEVTSSSLCSSLILRRGGGDNDDDDDGVAWLGLAFVLIVRRSGPSSFLAMSYFIWISRCRGLASVRAHDGVLSSRRDSTAFVFIRSSVPDTSAGSRRCAWIECKNSSLFDRLFLERFCAMNWEIDRLILTFQNVSRSHETLLWETYRRL